MDRDRSWLQENGGPSPPSNRTPLVHDLDAAEDVVAVKAGGGETRVIGDDTDTGPGVERFDAWAGERAVFLTQSCDPQAW